MRITKPFLLSIITVFFVILLWNIRPVFSADEQAQVLGVKGEVQVKHSGGLKEPLKIGDTVRSDDIVETGQDGSAEIAYDAAHKNVVQIESDSQVTVDLASPGIRLRHGALYAKLKALSKNSSFDVSTPTAIATVRGSEYRTTFEDTGGTRVYNFSNSPVYVYGINGSGHALDKPVVIGNLEKTKVAKPGDQPTPPEKMSAEEIASGKRSESAVASAVEESEKKEAAPSGAGPAAQNQIKENAEAVLQEMARAYEAKDFTAFMSRVSEDFPYRGELEEFTRRDFRDYDGIKLNLFIKRIEKTPNGARIRADWQIQLFPTAIDKQIQVRGDNLDFIFTQENGKLKFKAQRGANPLFGARSPEVATLSGVSSTIARTLETVEDTGNRASKQTAITLVGKEDTSSNNQQTPVNMEVTGANVFNETSGLTESLNAITSSTGIIHPQLSVRLIDNPKNVSLTGVSIEVTDSRTGIVLRGSGDLIAGRVNTFRTTGSTTYGAPAQTGTYTYVVDPDHQFNFIDRSKTRDVEHYTTV